MTSATILVAGGLGPRGCDLPPILCFVFRYIHPVRRVDSAKTTLIFSTLSEGAFMWRF